MKSFITLLFILFLQSVQASNYYFSALRGDDSRSAAEAKNPSTPWKSIEKLNTYFSALQPGDSVLFSRGESFYGTITVNKSGIGTAPIVVSAYGSGSKPVITALTNLVNWVAAGNGVYESYNPSLGASLSVVLLNNAAQPLGRYPNSGYMTLESHSGNTITDNELPSSPNWAGAELVLRTNHWKVDRYNITSHSGNTLTYSGNYSQNNYGYFIQNSVKTLDQLGEWCYNAATKKVSMYFGSKSPSSCQVGVSTLANSVYSYRFSYVVFDNLTFKGANSCGVSINSGSNMTVKNCDILFSGTDGVKISGHSYFTIEGCNVLNSYNNGISAGWSNANAVVRNNVVRNTYYVAGMGQSGDGQGTGIGIGVNGLAEYNQVINSGFLAIRFDKDNAVVKNNYIDTFCFIKDDGAGIYTYNDGNITNYGRKITGNIVLNGIGAPAGTNTTSSSAEGIYLDDNTNGVEISGNTVANCNRGIYLHNARQIVTKNNTIYNNKGGQLYMKHDNLGDNLRNHTITNNTFFSRVATQLVSSLNSISDDINSTGRMDSNYYARPIDDKAIIAKTIYYNLSNQNTVNHDLEGWKLQTKLDMTSRTSTKKIMSYKLNSIIGLNKYIYGSFNTSTEGAKVWVNNCTSTWSNSGMLDGGYLKIVPSASNSVVFNVGQLTAGKKYIVKYSIKSDDRMSVAAFLRASSALSWTPLTAKQYNTASTLRSENEMVFCPSKSDAGSTLVFMAEGSSAYYLDNIKVYEADASVTNPDDSIRFVINPGQVSKTVALDGIYVDARNNKFSNSIMLQPYQSAVLIKSGAGQNAAPAVSLSSPAVNASVASTASVTISAQATDSDGTITKVEFYNGSALLGTAVASPYTFTWSNVATGTYSITAKATDNAGATTTSAAVAFSVYASNVAPTVSLTSPVAAESIASPASVTISAKATDSDGTISKVEFYNGNALLGTAAASPYTFTWSNVATGTYSITAKATDNAGLTTTSAAVAFSVFTPNVAPTVSITSPVAAASVASPAPVTISADANDTDGTISKVEFYNNDTILATVTASPYTFNWNNIAAGTYSVTAKATDNAGATTTSAAVTFSVYTPNVAPTVSLTSPVAAASVASPASVTLSADANDTDGTISQVEFYNNDTLLATVTASPYTFDWNNIPAGTYSVTAKATDNGGLTTASAAVTFSVYTPNVAPTVSLTSPVAAAKYVGPAIVIMTASAFDTDGTISKVEFYNGTTLLTTVLASPYTFSWNSVSAGNYSITAKATDNNGAVTASAAVDVAVTKNILPSVSITSPVINAKYASPATINMSAVASDADGKVSKVIFYNGTTLLHTETTAPYTYSWLNVSAGNYTITAKAIDDKGAVTTSASVTVSVVAPTASLKTPDHDTTSVINSNHAIVLTREIAGKKEPAAAEVKLFPNPAVNKIQISFNGVQTNNQKATLFIQTVSGITVKSIPVTLSGKTVEADVTSLTAGTYIVNIAGDNFKITKKFIKN